MTDYQDHIELRRLGRGRIVTAAIAFVTAFAFVWAEPWAMTVALGVQVVIWGTWALVIQGDIRLLKKRGLAFSAMSKPATYDVTPIVIRKDGTVGIADGSHRNVIPPRDTRRE